MAPKRVSGDVVAVVNLHDAVPALAGRASEDAWNPATASNQLRRPRRLIPAAMANSPEPTSAKEAGSGAADVRTRSSIGTPLRFVKR